MIGVTQVKAQASFNHTYTEGATVAAGTDYFLYNIGSGQFLTDGMDWGTHATADHAGRVITFAEVTSGKYSIYTASYSVNNSVAGKPGYMTTNGYLDTGTNDANWEFTPVSVAGYTNAYTIKNSDTQYLYFNAGDCRVNVGESTNNNYSYWIIVPKTVRDAVGDYTYYLMNTDMNHPWERKVWAGLDNNNQVGGNADNRCAERYHAAVDVSQTIAKDVPNGRYRLYAQGFWRQDGSAAGPNFYANSDTKTFGILTGTENSMADASTSFTAGKYVNSVETFVSDGKLKVGINITDASQWVIFDNFYLEYLGQCVMDYAEALPDGGAMAADTWYYFDVETAGGYIMTATKLDDIVYTTDGYAQIDGVSTTLSSPATLSVTRYYVKSSSENELTYVIDSYDLTEEIAAYNTAVTNANTAKTNAEAAAKVNASEKSALDDAIATYTGEGAKAVDVEGTQNSAMKAALEEATPALVSATNAVNASINAYEGAATKLAAMKELVDATNVYTPDGLNTYYTTPKGKYDAGTLTTEEANALQNPFTKTGWRETNTTVDDFLMSAWDETTLQWGSYHVNTWSNEGDSDGSNFKVPFIEFWADDKTSLGTKTMTATITGLSANSEYAVSAWVRVRQTNDQTKVPESITLQVGDGEAVDVTGGTQVGNTQFYLGKYTAGGSTDNDGNLTIKFNVAANSNISWLAFQNVKYDVAAGTADYAALNAAIEAAEGKTLGFEDGEYAPYNNLDAQMALVMAKAVDQSAANAKSYIETITNDVSTSWTANVGNVECVYNGNFAEGQGSPAANIQQYGWTRTNGWGQFKNDVYGSTTGYYNQPGSLQYGNAGYYSMPLKANTVYRLQFQYGAWDGAPQPTVSVLNEEKGMAAQVFDATSVNYKEGLTSVDMLFVTADAGNYILPLANNGNIVFTGASITKAASQILTFADDAAMPAFAPGTYPNVSVGRALTADTWSTLVMPVNMNIPDGWSVMKMSSFEENTLDFTAASSIEAGKPYMVKVNSDVTDIVASNVEVSALNLNDVTVGGLTMKGVYEAGSVPVSVDGATRYVVSGNQLHKVTSAVSIKPFRAYFELIDSNSPARLVISFDGEDPTGINAVEAIETEAGTLKDGKYLIEGKIVLVKNGVKYGANGQKLN